MKALVLAFYLAAISSVSALTVRDLGFPGESSATGINDWGQVIGRWMNPQTGLFEGFLWYRGDWISLGSFSPVKINNVGMIVGYAPGGSAFYRNGSVTLLPTGTLIGGLSDSGFITGLSIQTGKPYRYNIYTRHMENIPYDLPPPPDPLFANYAYGTAVNIWGTVVGIASLNDNNVHLPFIYRNGSLSQLPADLIWNIYFIGDNGVIAGQASLGGLPFILNGSQYITPQLPGGISRGLFYWVNSCGVAVGLDYPDGGPTHAIMYRNGVVTDLYVAHGMNTAYQINNRGQIVGDASIGGTNKAVILNP